MVFIILYILSFPVNLYYNYFAGMSLMEKSLIASKPFFHLVHVALNLCSIAGLWFQFGWKVALGAFIVSWTFDKYSYKFFFQQCVFRTAQRLIESEWFEQGLTPDDRLCKAYEAAEIITWNNVRGIR